MGFRQFLTDNAIILGAFAALLTIIGFFVKPIIALIKHKREKDKRDRMVDKPSETGLDSSISLNRYITHPLPLPCEEFSYKR